MNQQTKPRERNGRDTRRRSNIIFNLLALALLLTVIVFLRQILKKPDQSGAQQVKAVSQTTATEAHIALPPPAMPAPVVEPAPVAAPAPEIEIVQPPKIETKRTVAVVEQPPIRRTAKITLTNAAYDLDDETARQRYLEENRRVSQVTKKIEEYIPFENK